MNYKEIIGLIGDIIVTLAYLPQFTHLLKEKDSTGISLSAWLIWLIGTGMILFYAATTKDPVFISLQLMGFVFILAIVVLAIRYRKRKI